jgi:hypothetical protein
MAQPEPAHIEVRPHRRGLMAWCGGKIIGEVVGYCAEDEWSSEITIRISKSRNLVDRSGILEPQSDPPPEPEA